MYEADFVSSENGVVCPRENELSREEAVKDDFRIDYLSSYADTIATKISEGVPVKSYLMWAWTDNFECTSLDEVIGQADYVGQEGFTARFGVVWIDYKDGCKRYPKQSAAYMKKYFQERIQAA
jgi:beta-glucosidase